MFGASFYHNLTRKYNLLFANFFNNINIARVDENGNVVQSLKIPLEYSQKQKIEVLARRPKRPEVDAENDYVAIILPRMGYELLGISYDRTRQLQSTIANRYRSSTDSNSIKTQFIQVPYNLEFALYIIAKNNDDALRIVEQILPYFTPNLTVTAKLIPELDLNFDIHFEMTGMNYEDDYDNSDVSERRTLIYTLNFTIKGWYFGPISNQGLIKKVVVDFYNLSGADEITSGEMAIAGRDARLTILPGLTANGEPTTLAANSIPYYQINIDDDYGFIEDYEEFTDEKRRDPKTGYDTDI